MCPEFFRWGEDIVVGCLNLLNKIVKSFTEEIISWILDPNLPKRGDKSRLSSKNQFDMNWWRSLSLIHKARFTSLFSLLWSAKTPLKVCDTSISMLSFHKLTFLVLIVVSLHHLELWWWRYGDCWLSLRYFKTSFSCMVEANGPLYSV